MSKSKVYIVLRYVPHERSDYMGTFSTLELAQEYIENMPDLTSYTVNHFAEVMEVEIDNPDNEITVKKYQYVPKQAGGFKLCL